MAKAGDEFVNPVTRLRTVFRKIAQDASVEQLHVDWIGDPSCRYSGYFQDLDGRPEPPNSKEELDKQEDEYAAHKDKKRRDLRGRRWYLWRRRPYLRPRGS